MLSDDPVVTVYYPKPRLGRAVQVGVYGSWISWDEDGQTITEFFTNEEFDFMEEA